MSRLPALLVAIALVFAFGPTAAQAAPEPVTVDLNARVLDGGEQVVSVTLRTADLGEIDAASLSTQTFSVHARAESPVPLGAGDVLYSPYDLDRQVTGVRVVDGDIVVDLAFGEGMPGTATLGYLVPAGRNVPLVLSYTVAQQVPFRLADGSSVTLDSFVQGDLLDPEVDAFSARTSATGLKYRLFEPAAGKKHEQRALILWLHGNGEGAIPQLYSNEPQLRANRGALGPATPEAQAIFGGAYVVAPQVPGTWYDVEAEHYDSRLKALIDEVAARYPVDKNRIYVMGASAGGMMTVKLVAAYPDTFAAAVPTTPALFLNRTGQYTTTEAQVLGMARTPTWFVHSKDDPTIPYEKASLWAYNLLKPYGNVLLTSYDHVVWDGYTFNGHWSWIYTARNDPTTDKGRSLWEWMDRQNLRQKHMKK